MIQRLCVHISSSDPRWTFFISFVELLFEKPKRTGIVPLKTFLVLANLDHSNVGQCVGIPFRPLKSQIRREKAWPLVVAQLTEWLLPLQILRLTEKQNLAFGHHAIMTDTQAPTQLLFHTKRTVFGNTKFFSQLSFFIQSKHFSVNQGSTIGWHKSSTFLEICATYSFGGTDTEKVCHYQRWWVRERNYDLYALDRMIGFVLPEWITWVRSSPQPKLFNLEL